MVEHLLAKERVESSNLFIRLMTSLLPNQEVLIACMAEPQLLIEAAAVGGHEIDPFHFAKVG